MDINYRVGIFGFLASTELSAEDPDDVSGNYALKDQIAALTWIKDNITTFGGDPTKVTIAGQSAGSQNVNQLTICPKTEGLFGNAVTMSYNLAGSQYVTLADKEAEGDAIFGGRSLEEMRALSSEEVQALSGSDLASAVASYNVDGKFVIGNYDEVLTSGKGLNVNVMSDYLVNFATTDDVNGSTVPTWNAYASEGHYSYIELATRSPSRPYLMTRPPSGMHTSVFREL